MRNGPYEEGLEKCAEGHNEEAAKLLEGALNQNPHHADALEALGVVYHRLGRMDEAIDLMKRLAKLTPNAIMPHTNLSRFYMEKGMIAEAESEQAEARRLSWKAELKEKKSTEPDPSIEEKIERFKKVIAFDPLDVLGYFSLGTAYAEGKRYQEAEETFRKAVEAGPKHSPSYLGLGDALEHLGRFAEAIQVCEKGVEVAGANGDIIPERKMQARLKSLRQKAL